MNERKRLIKNTGIIAIGSLSTKLISFLLLPLYTAYLSTEEFGTVDYIISLSAFCVPFVSFLMDEAVFRFLIDCRTDDDRKVTVSSSLFLVILGEILFILISIPVMIAIKYKYAVYLVLYVASAVLTQMTSSLIRGMGKTSTFVVLSFMVSAITLILNVLLIAVFNVGLKGMLISSIVAHTVVPIIFICRFRLWRLISFKKIQKYQVFSMIKYSVPLIPNKISWSIINLSDRIMIMNIIGSSASGLYAAAYKFPNLTDTVYGFFYQSWKESSARALHNEDIEKFYNSTYSYLKNVMYAFVVVLTAFMPVAFNILINKSYNEAIVYVPPLILATYFSNISGFYGGIFTAYKDTKVMGTTTIIAAVINIALNILLISTIGLWAAAVSTLVSNFVVYMYRKFKVKKYVQLEEQIPKSIFAVAIMLIIWFLFYSMKTEYHIAGYAVAVIYALFINRKLILQIFNIIKRRIKK